ncbi:MAG: hypothetical protein ACI4LX_01580 [Treponema sp.]
MKKNLKEICCSFFLLFNFFNLFSGENINDSSAEDKKYFCEDLLCGYLEHDLELQKLTLGVAKSELSLEQTKINQGFDISISTGTMTFYTGSSEAGSTITVKPSLTAKIPAAKNISATVSTDYQYKTSTKTNELKDTKFSVSFDALSQTEALSKITLMKSERELVEAKRKLQTAALSAEKKFYTELEDILVSINNIFTYFQEVYTDRLNLEKLKAQGYSSSSSTYRIAEMKVLTGEHDIDTAIHNLKLDFIVFYQHCGINVEFENERNFLSFIPENIPVVESLNFTDFEKDKYSEIESANWTYKINELTRKADKYFSLGFNAGYTMKNSTTKTDTVDAGVSTTIAGVGLNCGISVPVGLNDFTPAFTVSASLSPNAFRTKNITMQQYELTASQELLDIAAAEQNYETAVIAYNQSASNLKWEKESVAENFSLYQKTEADLEKYFKMGIVTESEYLTARNNRQLYEVKIIINRLEYILYNNDLKSQFVDL